MHSNHYLKTFDSLNFLIKLTKKSNKKSTYVTFTHEQYTANFFAHSNKKRKGLVVIFHGAHQNGNLDPRLINLAAALSSLGYDCLLPKIPSFIEIRPPLEDDFNSMTLFLNHIIANKIEQTDNLYFIGPSTSCLYMMKIAVNEQMHHAINAMCFISPYFNPVVSFKEILEMPRSPYAQLLLLKYVLYNKNLHQSDPELQHDLALLDRIITQYDSLNKEAITDDICRFIAAESPQSKNLLLLVQNMGKPGFVTEELHPYFIEIINKTNYDDCLQHLKSKIIMIHAHSDSIFLPDNSYRLAQALDQHNISNYIAVTKMLNHVDLVYTNLIKESVTLVKTLNQFFAS